MGNFHKHLFEPIIDLLTGRQRKNMSEFCNKNAQTSLFIPLAVFDIQVKIYQMKPIHKLYKIYFVHPVEKIGKFPKLPKNVCKLYHLFFCIIRTLNILFKRFVSSLLFFVLDRCIVSGKNFDGFFAQSCNKSFMHEPAKYLLLSHKCLTSYLGEFGSKIIHLMVFEPKYIERRLV